MCIRGKKLYDKYAFYVFFFGWQARVSYSEYTSSYTYFRTHKSNKIIPYTAKDGTQFYSPNCHLGRLTLAFKWSKTNYACLACTNLLASIYTQTVYSSARYKNAVAEAVVLQELVVPTVMERLRDKSTLVVNTATQALNAVRQRAPDAFQVILMQLPADIQSLYSAACGRSASPPLDGRTVAEQMAGTVTVGTNGVDSEHIKRTASQDADKHFGFVPGRLIVDLQDALNWRVRALAIEELQQIVKSHRDATAIRARLPEFMDFMLGLVRDPNFKIEIHALQVMAMPVYVWVFLFCWCVSCACSCLSVSKRTMFEYVGYAQRLIP
jgi:hypothetical protein